MVFEVRPAHDGVVIDVEGLSGSVWMWHRDGDRWAVRKLITIPAEPAESDALPPALKPFGAVPPVVSDIDLSVDDRWLYVSCWGTGELKQYDVSDPFHPRETGSVRLGGVVRRQLHPAAPDQHVGGGPQMVEVSRDGRRVYVTNSHGPDPVAIVALLAGWQVMVAAMMLPPEIASTAADTPYAHRFWWTEAAFVAVTTCAVWTGFAIVALVGDAVVHEVAESRPRLADLVAPAVLVGTGVFQLSPLPRHLLAAARQFRAPSWRRATCVFGSCWGLMLVVFALEVGNFLAMAVVTVVMTMERTANPPMEPLTAHLAGWMLIAAGGLVAILPA